MIPGGSRSGPTGQSIPRESGDDPYFYFIKDCKHSIPRESGDDPGKYDQLWCLEKYSPRERG